MHSLCKKLISLLVCTTVMFTSIFSVYGVEQGHTLTRGINSYSYATVTDLQKVTKGTRLYGYEQQIINVERKYQVNAFFILAVANVETGMGNAGVGLSRNNCFGMRGNSDFYYYNNPGQSVDAFGSLISNFYFANGRYTAYQIGQWYCDTYWASKVTNEIDRLYYNMI